MRDLSAYFVEPLANETCCLLSVLTHYMLDLNV